MQVSSDGGATWVAATQDTATSWSYADPATHATSFSYQARVVDTAGNVGSTDSQAVTIDTAAPIATVDITAIVDDTGASSSDFITSDTVLTVSGTNGALVAGETVQVSSDGGATWVAAAQDSATSWSYADPATHATSFSYQARVVDTAGNVGSTDSQAITIDTAAPSVVITDDEAGTANIAGGTITYTFTFSQSVNGFAVADVVVVGGTKAGTFASGVDGSSVYTLVITPNAGFQGILTVNVPAGVATDLAGNPNTAAPQSVQAVDTLAPTVVITDDEAGTANIAGGTITYTFTFSQSVNGFAVGDVVVVGGTKAGTFASGADGSSVYTLVITPNAGFQGNLTVDVAAGVATDLAGNPNTAAPQSVQAVDTLAPSVVITDDEAGTANIAGGDDHLHLHLQPVSQRLHRWRRGCGGWHQGRDVRLRGGRLLRLHPGDHAECGLPRQPHGQCCSWRCHRLGRQPEHRGAPVGAGRGHAGAVGCDHR